MRSEALWPCGSFKPKHFKHKISDGILNYYKITTNTNAYSVDHIWITDLLEQDGGTGTLIFLVIQIVEDARGHKNCKRKPNNPPEKPKHRLIHVFL